MNEELKKILEDYEGIDEVRTPKEGVYLVAYNINNRCNIKKQHFKKFVSKEEIEKLNNKEYRDLYLKVCFPTEDTQYGKVSHERKLYLKQLKEKK